MIPKSLKFYLTTLIKNNIATEFAVILLFLLFTGIVVEAQTQVGYWDYGPSYDVVAYGNYLYVAAGGQVRIYDISTKAKIENISFEPVRLFNGYTDVGTFREKTPPVNIIHTDAGVIQGLFTDGNYLYIIGERKFVIADISNPLSASVISYLNLGGKDVVVQGNYAYITTPDEVHEITIVDVSDKSNPYVAAYIDLNEDVRRLDVAGNYLVTGGNDIFLYVFDISDPLNPTLLGTWSDPYSDVYRSVSSVAMSGNYVYVVDYHWGIHVVDISDPANPVEVNSVIGESDPNANDIKIFGNYIFISTRYEGFRVYDTNLNLVAVFSGFPGYSEGIFVHQTDYGLYVFVTGYSTGWSIVDASDIRNPKLLAKMFVPLCDSIAVKGNYAFYGGHNDGVWVVDVSDPTNPKEVILIKNKGRNTGLTVDGNYLYISGSWAGLTIVNISNPEDPIITVWDFNDNADGNLIVVDNYLYEGGVNVFDVSDKYNPRLVYSADLGFGLGAQPLTRYGDYLIFGGRNGLFIVDISDRVNPVVVGRYNVNMYTGDAEVVGNVVFAVEGSGELYAINISNPANPKLLDSTNGVIANGIAVYGNKAYLLPRILAWGGLRVVDISDPENLVLVDTVEGVYGEEIASLNENILTGDGHIFNTHATDKIRTTATTSITISDVVINPINCTSVVIEWNTNIPTRSTFKYGILGKDFIEEKYVPENVLHHKVTLTGLNEGETYFIILDSHNYTFNTCKEEGNTLFNFLTYLYKKILGFLI